MRTRMRWRGYVADSTVARTRSSAVQCSGSCRCKAAGWPETRREAASISSRLQEGINRVEAEVEVEVEEAS